MSHVSITSTKRDDDREKHAERVQELESVKALNRSLSLYLEHLRVYRKNLTEANKNMDELTKVNKQWDDLLSMRKVHQR